MKSAKTITTIITKTAADANVAFESAIAFGTSFKQDRGRFGMNWIKCTKGYHEFTPFIDHTFTSATPSTYHPSFPLTTYLENGIGESKIRVETAESWVARSPWAEISQILFLYLSHPSRLHALYSALKLCNFSVLAIGQRTTSPYKHEMLLSRFMERT